MDKERFKKLQIAIRKEQQKAKEIPNFSALYHREQIKAFTCLGLLTFGLISCCSLFYLLTKMLTR